MSGGQRYLELAVRTDLGRADDLAVSVTHGNVGVGFCRTAQLGSVRIERQTGGSRRRGGVGRWRRRLIIVAWRIVIVVIIIEQHTPHQAHACNHSCSRANAARSDSTQHLSATSGETFKGSLFRAACRVHAHRPIGNGARGLHLNQATFAIHEQQLTRIDTLVEAHQTNDFALGIDHNQVCTFTDHRGHMAGIHPHGDAVCRTHDDLARSRDSRCRFQDLTRLGQLGLQDHRFCSGRGLHGEAPRSILAPCGANQTLRTWQYGNALLGRITRYNPLKLCNPLSFYTESVSALAVDPPQDFHF